MGRDPCTKDLNLAAAGVTSLDAKSGKLIVNSSEQTNVPNIFALGDLLLGKPELTPVAIRAGRLLAKRLFGGSSELCDYQNVPTTVFTPMEYGSCGLAEEDALAQYGEDVETFLQGFTPLEYTVSQRDLFFHMMYKFKYKYLWDFDIDFN